MNGDFTQVVGGRGIDTLDIFNGFALTSDITMAGTNGQRVVATVSGVRTVEGSNVEIVRATGGDGDDFLRGLSRGDTLEGGLGNDTLKGFGGSDRLVAEGGIDNLWGGPGADTFSFGSGADEPGSLMRARDFSSRDTLEINDIRVGIRFPSDAEPGFVAEAAPAPETDLATFLFDTRSGNLSYDADGTGPADDVLIARLTNGGDAASLTFDQLTLL